MLNTPTKTQNPSLFLKLLSKAAQLIPSTEQKRPLDQQLDGIPTPKKGETYVPLEDRLLRTYAFDHIKQNRAKMMDWYLQISFHYHLGWECFWFTVELVDSLIAQFNYLNIRNIELVGIVCIFIAAKYMGKRYLDLRNVKVYLGHCKFSQTQILTEQSKILKIIFERSNFQRNHLYNYLMEKYSHHPLHSLTEALKMLTVAMMKPDISTKALKVSTYKELVDAVMIEVQNGTTPKVLIEIHEDMKTNLRTNRIGLYADKMLL